MSNSIPNYYRILGISQDASDIEIKKAYREKAKMYHPDVSDHPDAHNLFIEIGEAYAVLKDPEKRFSYDEMLRRGQSHRGNNHHEKQYEQTRRAARAQAEEHAEMSIDEFLENVLDFVIQTGKVILVGDENKIRIRDYISMGFFGLALTISIIITLTGIGTIPGLFLILMVLAGVSNDDSFHGFIPFILSTIVANLIVGFVLFLLIQSLFF